MFLYKTRWSDNHPTNLKLLLYAVVFIISFIAGFFLDIAVFDFLVSLPVLTVLGWSILITIVLYIGKKKYSAVVLKITITLIVLYAGIMFSLVIQLFILYMEEFHRNNDYKYAYYMTSVYSYIN